MPFATEFESESRLSPAICANALRVLTGTGVPLRDIPILTGVSKEAVAMSIGFLDREKLVTVYAEATDPRTNSARITPQGAGARDEYLRLPRTIDGRWWEQFGADVLDRLREYLAILYTSGPAGRPRLAEGMTPYPDGWRASSTYLARTNAALADPRNGLPHFPMELHRGGYPDGS